MAKTDFSIKLITKSEAGVLLNKYHYLTNISRGFKSGFNFGLFYQNNLIGVCIFTGFPVPELSVGLLGLNRSEQDGLLELSRLCLEPDIQKTEHNLASWFVSKCIKLLRKQTNVRIILSYADQAFHTGTVYMACNFKYYGLTDSKKDFYIKNNDGSFTKHSRGSVKNLIGEWKERTRKHRFLLIFDSVLNVKWKEQDWKYTKNKGGS